MPVDPLNILISMSAKAEVALGSARTAAHLNRFSYVADDARDTVLLSALEKDVKFVNATTVSGITYQPEQNGEEGKAKRPLDAVAYLCKATSDDQSNEINIREHWQPRH